MANCKGMNNIKLQSQQRQKAPLVMKLINSLSMGMEIEIMPFFLPASILVHVLEKLSFCTCFNFNSPAKQI